MDRENVREVLRDVFGANLAMKDVGGWVSICCPLATWLHDSGHDAHPSAGVSCNDDDTSIFSCFTCHTTGPFHYMLERYAEFSGEDLSDIIGELEENEFLGPRSLPTWDAKRNKMNVEVQHPLDESIFMDLYDPAWSIRAARDYLKERGISQATAEKMELLFDPRDPVDDEPRILFPVRGYDGLLYGFSGRALNKKAFLKVRDYHGFKKSLNVLGAHLAAKDKPDKILLVEGLFDVAKTIENGYCGCGVMHSTVTDAQAEILRDIGKPTYLFFDNPKIDNAGRSAVEKAGHLLQRYVPVMRVRYPDIEVEDDAGNYHTVKDPGELLKEDVEQMIKDSRIF